MDNKSCKGCSHRQNYDGLDRCTRYHNSKCESVYGFCNGDYFMDKDDGVSLYAMRDWLNRLSREELELPLIFYCSGKGFLVPFYVMRTIHDGKDEWVFYAKEEVMDGDYCYG